MMTETMIAVSGFIVDALFFHACNPTGILYYQFAWCQVENLEQMGFLLSQFCQQNGPLAANKLDTANGCATIPRGLVWYRRLAP
jgi:hypothetical protein